MENGQNTETLALDQLASSPGSELPPAEQMKKKRGRPPGSHKKSTSDGEKRRSRAHNTPVNTSHVHDSTSPISMEFDDERLAYTLAEEKLSPFSSLLRNILRHDRLEIARVARELDVAENTIYRWMNGNSEPRPVHLRRLPDVLPEHRNNLSYAINQTFEGVLDFVPASIQEVSKDIYCQILEQVYTIEEPDTRFWNVSQSLFEYALAHLDSEKQGLSVIYATLMPPHRDGSGIYSLREMVMRGNEPWPPSFESKAFLGSNTLAGATADMQRTQIWDSSDEGSRLLVEVDEHEASACATPVMRGGAIAGVLIVSSTQSGFFRDPMAVKAVEEFARLLATALPDRAFYSYQLLHLRPMPDLSWQRTYIAEHYVARILSHVRKFSVSRSQAEEQVLSEMELEFEEEGRGTLDQLRRTRSERLQNAVPLPDTTRPQ
jgi:transcriptional regulator with XRE-family HTH domain